MRATAWCSGSSGSVVALGGLCLVVALAACGSGAASSGSSSSSGTGAGATSSSSSGAGAGAASSSSGSSSGASGSASSSGSGATGAGGGCTTTPTWTEVLAKPLSGCSGLEPPCHNAGAAMLKFTPADAKGAWAAFVNVPASTVGAGTRVVPGDPAHSFLYRKLTNDLTPDEGQPMPGQGQISTGWKELPADEIEMVRCWILGGAKDD